MIFAAAPVSAHFLLNLNVRIFHVEHLSDGLKIYIRTPMPYLVADRIGPIGAGGLPEPAPFTTNRMESGKPVHYVDPVELRSNSTSLGRMAADRLLLTVGGEPLSANVERLQAYPIGKQPAFATLGEAKAAFASEAIYPADAEPAYVGDVVVDMILLYKSYEPIYNYSISSALDPGLPGQEDTANLILDHGPGDTNVFRARGLLAEPVVISRSIWSAITTFIKEGIRHILSGWDHVLFILCLAIGATRLHSLIWRATGFTLGHSVTLIAGFFGYVPNSSWFIPAVELGIALSIIYAAIIALSPDRATSGKERELFGITTAIGLLHGLGFSFVLHEILQINSPSIWQSLLAFNLGVEVGQLLIIIAVWPLFHIVKLGSEFTGRILRWGVATSCSLVALYWVGERALTVIATF
ncbi:MAG: HupE/UreJ family protein [Rhizobiaceae bacterium]